MVISSGENPAAVIVTVVEPPGDGEGAGAGVDGGVVVTGVGADGDDW
jgi:hypothetical protein